MPRKGKGRGNKRPRVKSENFDNHAVPFGMLVGASAYFNPHEARRHREAKMGKFGAASEVRKIDPKEYEGAEIDGKG